MFPAMFMVGVTAVVAALVVAGTVFARHQAGGGSIFSPGGGRPCTRSLRVVTASSFLPVLSALAPKLSAGDDCVGLELSAIDGRAAVRQIVQLGADVWIPDDTAWTGNADLTKLAADGVVSSGTVVATSPIFMVTDQATGERVTKAGGSWLGLARLLTDGSGVRLVVRDPAGSGDGLIGAAAVGEAVWLDKGMDASSLALANVLSVTRTVTGKGPALPLAPGEVGLVPEYALLGVLNRLDPELTLFGGTDHSALLRFTWLPSAAAVADPERESALRRLLVTLTGPDAAKALAAAGLRDGAAERIPAAAADVVPDVSAKPFDVIGPHHVDHVFATWYPQDRRMNLLIVVDISGSMGTPVPGSNVPPIDLIRRGCLSLNNLLPEDAAIGLWEFGVLLDPPHDYHIALPSAPLAQGQRQALVRTVNGLFPRRTGTGLYDTLLAAYVSVREAYRQDMPNRILLFTDGRNEGDSNSITAAQLGANLAAAKDPNRPIQVGVVSFGQAQDVAELKAALKPIEGYVANLHTAEEVASAFIHVVAGGLHS